MKTFYFPLSIATWRNATITLEGKQFRLNSRVFMPNAAHAVGTMPIYNSLEALREDFPDCPHAEFSAEMEWTANDPQTMEFTIPVQSVCKSPGMQLWPTCTKKDFPHLGQDNRRAKAW
jgi:hypothetical protein